MNAAEPGEIGTLWKIGYVICCLAVFAIMTYASNSARGAVAGFAFAVVSLVARLRWDARDKPWFWLVIGGLALAHLALVFAVDWQIVAKPTILLAPFVIADFLVTLGAVFLAEKALT